MCLSYAAAMPPRPASQKLPACGFFVTVNATDHSVPMKIKKVAKGKRVSILSGITGSRSAAVSTLKQILGVGGEVSLDVERAIELQGDQTGRIATVLRNLDALRGEPVQPAVAAVRPNQGYEKFMKQKEPVPAATFPPPEMSKACILVHGKFWPYCNGDCSLCPPLTDVFEGLDMYCSWFEPEYAQPLSKPDRDAALLPPMTKKEMDAAFSRLGMKAEIGKALLSYEKEKRMRRDIVIPFAVEKVKEERVTPRQPPPVVKKPFVDKPVRIIMNQAEDDEDGDWCVLEVSLKDPSQWMAEYEGFVASLLAETTISVAHQELVDSRTLKLLFFDRTSMDECTFVLEEVMSNFFSFKKRDPLFPPEFLVPSGAAAENPKAEDLTASDDIGMHDLTESPELDFERMANELGLGENVAFWERFTQLVEDSDGTNVSLLSAFESAVVWAISDPQ